MINIYTIGGDAMDWRYEVEKELEYHTDKSISYIHHPLHSIKTKKKFRWFIGKILSCDIIVINFNELTYSDQLALASINTLNTISDKYIYVVGYGDSTLETSYFIDDIEFEHKGTLQEATEFIVMNLI